MVLAINLSSIVVCARMTQAANAGLIIGLTPVAMPFYLGQTILNYSFKYSRGQTVSLANMIQPLFAGAMGYLFFGEVPHPFFYFAVLLIAAGIFVALRSSQA